MNQENTIPTQNETNTTADDLAKRLVESGVIEKDLAEQIAENWQKVLVAVLVIIFAVWMYNQSIESSNRRLEQLSSYFIEGQNAFSVMQQSDSASQKQATDVFLSNMNILSEQDKNGFYGSLAQMYLSHYYLSQGENEKADEILTQYNPTLNTITTISKKSIVQGTAIFLTAQQLLSLDNEESDVTAKELLVSLMINSQTLQIESFITYVRVFEPEGKLSSELNEIYNNITQINPEIKPVLDSALRAVGKIID